MNQNRKVRLGIVGLEFGAEFIPIYQKHRNSEIYAICQRTKAHLDKIGDEFGVAVRYTGTKKCSMIRRSMHCT